jgi:hypothetical protein
MKARDVMVSPVITARPSFSVKEAAELHLSHPGDAPRTFGNALERSDFHDLR